jgi:Na+/H+-dicarboxylate symporter
MRRVRPERIFLMVVAPLVFGGFILFGVGAATKNHGLSRVGVFVFATGVVLTGLPLLLGLCYFGWKRLSGLWKRD